MITKSVFGDYFVKKEEYEMNENVELKNALKIVGIAYIAAKEAMEAEAVATEKLREACTDTNEKKKTLYEARINAAEIILFDTSNKDPDKIKRAASIMNDPIPSW